MAKPTDGRKGPHVCVLVEANLSSAFPVTISTYPLIVTHSSTLRRKVHVDPITDETRYTIQPFKLTTFNNVNDDGNNNRPNIKHISIYSQLKNFTIWQVPATKDRIIDFKLLKWNNPNEYTASIDSIAELILTYNIVYFIHLPDNYFEIIQDVVNKFRT